MPQAYSEFPKILFEEKILNKNQSQILRSLFSFRNEFAYEYDEILPSEIN